MRGKWKAYINYFVFVAVLIGSIVVSSENVLAETQGGTCGENLTWEFDSETRVLTISGIGPMTTFENSNVPWKSVTNKIKTIVVDSGVTSIGNYAFYSCSNVKRIELPQGIVSIGRNSMAACYALEEVNVPEGVISIGDFTFENCKKLQEVRLPQSLTSLGEGAFGSCDVLSIYVDQKNSVFSSKDGVLYNKDKTELLAAPGVTGEYVICDGVKRIGDRAFYECAELKSVTIPKGVTEIGESAFLYCYVLERIKMPDDLISIGEYAFSSCYGLKSVDIPDSVRSVGNKAFDSCTALTYVEIPSGVEELGAYAFDGCSALTTVVLATESIETVMVETFRGCSALETVIYVAGSAEDAEELKLTQAATQISYTENEDGTVSLHVISVSDEIANGTEELELPKSIDGKTISSVTLSDEVGNSLGDIAISCTKHYAKSLSYDATSHWIAQCSVCKKKEVEKEKHSYDGGKKACKCGYVPFVVTGISSAQTYVAGKPQGKSVSVTIKKTFGTETVMCQWYKNGTAISGATETSFYLSEKEKVGSYTYRCVISSGDYRAEKSIPVKVTAPAKGTVIKDAGEKAYYKVTKAGTASGRVGTLQYKMPVNKKTGNIVIPATLTVHGIKYKVTSIAKNALKGNRYVTKLSIGVNVSSIGKSAFQNCKKLKTITIRTKKLIDKSVGKVAFKGINNKATVKVPKKKYKAYISLLRKKGMGSKVTFKKI